MQKSGFNINTINAAFLSFVLLTGLWNMTVFYLPVLLITGIVGFIIIRSYPDTIPVSITAIAFVLLLLYEIVNFQFSSYPANSILFLRDFSIVLCCIFLINKLLKTEKYRVYLVVFISLMAGLLTFLNLPIFFFRYFEAGMYGFDDFTQFRFMYMPLKFFSNEWVTILFCFLPFPLIGLLLFRGKMLIRYGFLLITGLIVFNIFISFSRAGILAFLLFIGLLNLFFYFNRTFPIKKLLLYNGVLILFSILFAFCFSESILSSVYQTNSHQRSTEGRLNQWEEVTTLMYKYPEMGIGSKNYALLENQSRQLNLENSFSGRLNNTYIQLVVEKGWIGLSLWLSVIGILACRLLLQIKRERNLPDKAINSIVFSAILAILFKEIFFSSLLYRSGILLFFFTLLIFNNKENKTIKIRKPIVNVFFFTFMLGALYFYFKKPDNALLHAAKGLEYERSVDIRIPYNLLNVYSEVLDNEIARTHEGAKARKMDKEAYSRFRAFAPSCVILEAIRQYKEACRLSPYDALFQHNLGWLYWMNHQPDSAIIYISQAVKTDPNDPVCHISKGLITELQEPDQAFESYKQAVLLSPDIVDSPFFSDLKERNPEKAKKILQDAYKEMLQEQSARYSSVIEAKTGKILLALGDMDSAFNTLTHITQIHPNLNRPWYYLGYMEQLKGNGQAMQEYYKKSLFLSPFDYLPLYAFASYYKETGDQSKAESYFKAAEKAWKNKRSVHSRRCSWMYYDEDTEKDDIIPNGLFDYVSPVFKITLNDTN